MTTAEELYSKYPEVLLSGDLRDVPVGWLGIVHQYLSVVAPIMADTGYEVVTAKEHAGGLDWMWTSMLGPMTPERHAVIDREDTLLDLRSYHTCSTCGRPATGWKSGRKIMTACEEHGVGDRIERDAPMTRSTRKGIVQYDPAVDDLVVVWDPMEEGR
ncbi:hypothetical protein C3Y89_24180 [Rhizobium sp. UPM1132]|uniref:hypothetical protein n=1 Tax=Rhizobium ruizarguesonis TaxID=2081791 RepID=UPI001448076C|nr:hypothetical protein [Rhizobium ruizarguesonis]NKQ73406.1 hypothetical protein [Rhizobium ruizarguesonis]